MSKPPKDQIQRLFVSATIHAETLHIIAGDGQSHRLSKAMQASLALVIVQETAGLLKVTSKILAILQGAKPQGKRTRSG